MTSPDARGPRHGLPGHRVDFDCLQCIEPLPEPDQTPEVRVPERKVPVGLDDWTRLAEAWANVMDGRRIGPGGLGDVRIGRNTTKPDDWVAIVAEYRRLRSEETVDHAR